MKEHPTLKGYFATEDGKVFSNKREKLAELNGCFDGYGYRIVRLYCGGKILKKVHRFVAEVYLPNPNNLPFINHKDENKTNNNISNLEWCDHQYNNEYSKAKNYIIQHVETGKEFNVFNLEKFCREMLLNPSGLSKTFTKNRKHHKGYKMLKREG
jgi:hypothetical protein